MTPIALQIIRDEHLALASVIYSLRVEVRRCRDAGRSGDLALLHAMLDYIVEFPERLHHPKEDDYLFRALAERCPAARPLIDDLEREHVAGARMIGELQQALLDYGDEGDIDPLAERVSAYAAFHWQHMHKEEHELMPLALGHLTEQDWAWIGNAFRENDNPLFGIRPKDQADALYRRILALGSKPAPDTGQR